MQVEHHSKQESWSDGDVIDVHWGVDELDICLNRSICANFIDEDGMGFFKFIVGAFEVLDPLSFQGNISWGDQKLAAWSLIPRLPQDTFYLNGINRSCIRHFLVNLLLEIIDHANLGNYMILFIFDHLFLSLFIADALSHILDFFIHHRIQLFF